MARLPQLGGDEGTWGEVLNDFLLETHNTDGTLKPAVVTSTNLAPNAVSSSALSSNSVTSTELAVSGGIDGQVLTKDSGQTSGMKWATASSTSPQATVSSVGTVQLAGDLGGTATAPTVPGLASKEPTITAGNSTQYYRGDKTWQTLDKTTVGLTNVDNTADVDKPVSTAVQAALDTKVDATALGTKVLLIDNAASLPPGTPAGVIVVVKS